MSQELTAQKVQQGEKLEGLSGAGAMVTQADWEGLSEWGQVGQRNERREKKAFQAEGTARAIV